MALLLRPHLCVIAMAAAPAAFAQTAAESTGTTTTITVTGHGDAAPAIAGFGDIPLARSPLQAASYSLQQIQDAGIGAVSGLTRLDAAITDAYNAEGYWSFLTVRGFVLDNQFNYRRDGLPINTETFISLANKDRIEVLKGTSGIQAGTSAPGGLVDYIVKRPTTNLREAGIEWREDSTVIGHVDISQRFGTDDRFGLRINAEAGQLRPQTRNSDGSQRALALAADWQITADSKLEVEFETSARSQPSVPGFSLLGNRVPDAHTIDPRLSLNNQPWSLPVMLAGDTASVRWQQRLTADWSLTLHGATQRLKSDDRIAFPFGCTAENNFDRFCSNGSFDLYDFRSNAERRLTDALDAHADGSITTGPVVQHLTAGMLFTRVKARFGPETFNLTGTGFIDGSVVTPPAPDPLDTQTNRDERSTEAYLRDVITLADGWDLWAGLRQTRISRQTVGTDGTAATSYERSFTTPWLAIAHAINDRTLVYASWGEGVESELVSNLPIYVNRGQSLTERSRQTEAGIKVNAEPFAASVSVFEISRPLASDFCDGSGGDNSCTRALDGQQRHRGIEASAAWRSGIWLVQGSAMHLAATRQGASDPTLNGLRPTNVPADTIKMLTAVDIAGLPGLSVYGDVVYESSRVVLPDNSITIPGWTRFDLGARWQSMLAGQTQTWRIGVDNVADRRAWRESPFEFDHVYLFPLAPRTWRASLSSTF